MLLQKNIILFLLFILNVSFAFAQTPYIWQDKDFDRMQNFDILPDKGYSFKQIRTDSTLPFQKNPKVYKFEKEEYYWFRCSIKNPSIFSKKGYLIALPEIDNIVYYYDFESKKWKNAKLGVVVPSSSFVNNTFAIILPSKQTSTFYFKIKVADFKTSEYPVVVGISLYSEKKYLQHIEFVTTSWLVVLSPMILFFLYNLYVYFVFKDKSYLYYLIIILGGMLYITNFERVINIIQIPSFYNIRVLSNGIYTYYTFYQIIEVIFIWLIVSGYIQFTRVYLQLAQIAIVWDKVLKKLLIILTLFSIFFVAVSYQKKFFIYNETSGILNMLICFIILFIFYINIYLYRKGYKLAHYFLLANSFPFLVMMAIALYFLTYPTSRQAVRLLPHIALISQTLCFAIALVARINLLKDELKEKQLEAKTLQNENEEILARNRYIELENEYIMADMVEAVNKEADLQQKMKLEINQKTEQEQKLQQKIEQEVKQKADLQAKLESNQRELTANTLYLHQKNEMLINLEKQILNLSYKDTTTQNRKGIKEIKSTIKSSLHLENDWDKFKVHFEEVHPNFFTELNKKYPTLTKNEIRLSAYYHLNMSVKEIATLLNINPTSVHRAKSRLNKKMEAIDKGE